MTNIEAYMVYGLSESEGTLSLSRYSVDPVGTDANQVASAIGMIDKAMMSDYSQGSTSEKVSNELRSALLTRGKSILSQNGIEYLDGNSGVTINCKGF